MRAIAARRRLALATLGGAIATAVALLLLAVLATLRARADGVVTVPTSTLAATPTLRAPSEADAGDLDLHLAWRAAHVRQVLSSRSARWGLQQYSDLVVRDGEAHRALLVLPSSDGQPTRASFKVAIPADSDCELVAWVGLEGNVGTVSDGVDFAAAVAGAEIDPDTVPLALSRLSAGTGTTAWREVRVDLRAYAGRTVWVILATSEAGTGAGDWLLWADPRVRLKLAGDPVLDVARADAPTRRVVPVPWSEVNVFKPYSMFRERELSPDSVRWMARTFPWLESLRLFSALGANWGPTLERDYAGQMGKNPTFDGSWEAPLARRYEFFHDGPEWDALPLPERFEWPAFDALLDALGASELGLHLNLAGAPEAFTAHRGHYVTYHFNEMPVVDEAAWKAYVGTLFAHLAQRPWFTRAEISFFNEPNCRWTESDGTVRRFGYQGDAADYARQYLWTWQAMKPYVRPGQVHLGPWVAEPDAADPAVNNLAEFLGALRDAFARAGEPLPPWSGFAFNVYDTPQLTLDGVAATKIAYVREVLARELPGRTLPLRFDEIGLHPVIASAFARAGAGVLDETRWASAWHAEMLALLIDQRIDRADPWVSIYDGRPFASYLFASYVAGVIRYRMIGDDAIAFERRDGGAPESLHVRLASRHPDRVGALWSASADARTFRIAVWRYPRFAMSDARLVREPDMQPMELRLPAAPGRVWRLRVLGDAEQRFPAPGPALAPASPPRLLRVDGVPKVPPLAMQELTATARVHLELHAADVFLIEATASDAPLTGYSRAPAASLPAPDRSQAPRLH